MRTLRPCSKCGAQILNDAEAKCCFFQVQGVTLSFDLIAKKDGKITDVCLSCVESVLRSGKVVRR